MNEGVKFWLFNLDLCTHVLLVSSGHQNALVFHTQSAKVRLWAQIACICFLAWQES